MPGSTSIAHKDSVRRMGILIRDAGQIPRVLNFNNGFVYSLPRAMQRWLSSFASIAVVPLPAK